MHLTNWPRGPLFHRVVNVKNVMNNIKPVAFFWTSVSSLLKYINDSNFSLEYNKIQSVRKTLIFVDRIIKVTASEIATL